MEGAAEEPAMAAAATTTATTTATTAADSQTELANPNPNSDSQQQPLSKRAQKKLLKQQKYEAKKAEKKAYVKEQKRIQKERKQKEWEAMLSSVASEEEKLKLIESRRGLRKERMAMRSEEKEKKIERLTQAKISGQNIVIDLEFSHLMTSSEINSLVQQVQYPGHLWLTGIEGDMESQLKRLPGFDKWIIEKESRSYIEALQEQKENLVYLTADSETTLEELDLKKIYIIGGLVDRNRWKGITMKKAEEQGIQTARLPIGSYLKMSSSQVLTVNQVVEILLKFLELRDWKTAFFQVIPPRKRCGPQSDQNENKTEGDEDEGSENVMEGQKKLKMSETDSEASGEEEEAENGEIGEDNVSKDV